MDRDEKIKQTMFLAIDEFNAQKEAKKHLTKDFNTVLLGGDGRLDSLDLVSFLVAVEEAVNEEFDVSITLADERAMSQKESPFRTIGTLAQYVALLLDSSPHE